MAFKLIDRLHSIFGRKLVNQVESNFEDIEKYANDNEEYKEYHSKEQKNAHDSTQIIHKLVDGLESRTSDELKYQRQQIEELVLGHNGNGINELKAARTSMDAKGFGDLSNRLYHDFLNEKNQREAADKELLSKIQRVVNVDDFGADPTGQKDSSEAFKKALGSGYVQVTMSGGTYLLDKGIKLPNYTRLVGQGKDITTIKLSTKAPRETIAVTNSKMSGEARCISVEDFAINGNKVARFNEKTLTGAGAPYDYAQPSGGSLSSNLRFAGVKYGFAKNIKSYDTLLHCIDVTYASDDYYYEGDGNRVPTDLESKHIWIENCEAFGFGDDGITTHHSRYITITNCYSHDPKHFHGNANAYEIDDGSQFVFLNNNFSYNSYSGLEIKAHATSSAAHGIFVNNHMSIGDCRSYNPRHIGHHHAKTDAKSKTASNVVLNNCVALYPRENGVYPGYTSRALCISAYKNLTVNNFTAIGDENHSANNPAIAIQFMANNVTLNNIHVMGFRNASSDIKINGGDNRGHDITLSNINTYGSSNKIGIAGGSGVQGVKIIGANLQGNGTGNGIESYNNLMEIIGASARNYAYAAVIAGEKYGVVPTSLKGGLSAGSTGSAAVSPQSAVIASTGGSKAMSARSYVLGSGMKSIARGSRSSVQNSLSSETSSGGHTQMVFNSNNVKAVNNYHVVAGYASSGGPSEKNIKYDLSTYTGNLSLAGNLKQNNADYAEFFESQSGESISMGSIVALDGDKVRKAQPNDKMIGVISGTASVIGNAKQFHHKDRYLIDEYGVEITEKVVSTYLDDDGIEQEDVKELPIENPDYDPDADYTPRESREEWNVVGLLGQIHTNVDKEVQPGDSLIAKAGIGYKDNINGKGVVMAITSEYTEERGCAIALVLWGVN